MADKSFLWKLTKGQGYVSFCFLILLRYSIMHDKVFARSFNFVINCVIPSYVFHNNCFYLSEPHRPLSNASAAVLVSAYHPVLGLKQDPNCYTLSIMLIANIRS